MARLDLCHPLKSLGRMLIEVRFELSEVLRDPHDAVLVSHVRSLGFSGVTWRALTCASGGVGSYSGRRRPLLADHVNDPGWNQVISPPVG